MYGRSGSRSECTARKRELRAGRSEYMDRNEYTGKQEQEEEMRAQCEMEMNAQDLGTPGLVRRHAWTVLPTQAHE